MKNIFIKRYYDEIMLALSAAVCCAVLLIVVLFATGYPLRLKLSRAWIGRSFNSSKTIGTRLLNDKEHKTTEASFRDFVFEGTFRSLSPNEVEVCEGVILIECSVLEVENFPIFAASVHLYKESEYNANRLHWGDDPGQTNVIWTTLDNQISVNDAAEIIRRGIALRQSVRYEKEYQLQKCRQEQIVDDCN